MSHQFYIQMKSAGYASYGDLVDGKYNYDKCIYEAAIVSCFWW